MKRLFLLLLLPAVAVAAHGQVPYKGTERDRIVDSMAYRALDRVLLNEATMNIVESMSLPLLYSEAEYATFMYARNSLAGHYNKLSDEELRQVKDFMCSEPYLRLNSISFWNNFVRKVQKYSEALKGASSPVILQMPDKEYQEAATELIDAMSLEPVAESYCLICGLPGHLTGKVSKNAAALMVQNIADYLSYDQLAELLSFCRSDVFAKAAVKEKGLTDMNAILMQFVPSGHRADVESAMIAGRANLAGLGHLYDLFVSKAESAGKNDVIEVLKEIRSVPMPFYSYHTVEPVADDASVVTHCNGITHRYERKENVTHMILKTEHVYSGLFIDDVFVEGTYRNIHQTDEGPRIWVDFEGNIYSGNVWAGEVKNCGIIQGGYKRTRENGWMAGNLCELDGLGEEGFAEGSLSQDISGMFVRGRLYGDAVIRRTSLNSSGIFSETSLKGRFWNGALYGLASATEKITDIPVQQGKARVVRPFGIRILTRGVSSLTVKCVGEFAGDWFLKGKVTVSDGTWMDGEFEDGVLITGKAKTIDKYGTVYEGDIRNGYPHGEGRCTYKDGTWFKGKFADGNRMGGTHYTAEGAVIKVYQ